MNIRERQPPLLEPPSSASIRVPVRLGASHPSDIRLPAGRYDVQIEYGVAPVSSYTGGSLQAWIYGVDIQAGQTLNREYDLQLGQVTVDMLEDVVIQLGGKQLELDGKSVKAGETLTLQANASDFH